MASLQASSIVSGKPKPNSERFYSMKHTLRHIIIACLVALSSIPTFAAISLEEKAASFFDGGEWLNANASYLMLLKDNPGDTRLYSRAVVSSALAGDTIAALDLIAHSAERSVPTDSLWTAVRADSFKAGSPTLYVDLLNDSRTQFSWMRRKIDSLLLDYYNFRNDGPGIVHYANIMLDGMPDDVAFSRLLARGQLLSGDTTAAIATWQKILTTHPDQYDTLIDIGNCLWQSGQKDAARPYLQRAYDLRPTPYIANQLGVRS